MEILKIQANETIPFWREVTKPYTESGAEKNCDHCQTGTTYKMVVFVKVLSGFQSHLEKS